MQYSVIIPARLASTRLPNKPLADIAGVPMVVRVAQRVATAVPAPQRVVVATDSPQVLDACATWGIATALTRADHPSGTDRLAEVVDQLALADDEIVINVQGDEPLIDPALVYAVAKSLHTSPSASMATAAHPIAQHADLHNPNVVKVVLNQAQEALYFSRAAIPWWRDAPPDGAVCQPAPLRHIGIYAYYAGFLRRFPQLAAAPLEQIEALEQLRALWHGHRIAVHITNTAPGIGVDTADDLAKVRQHFALQAASA